MISQGIFLILMKSAVELVSAVLVSCLFWLLLLMEGIFFVALTEFLMMVMASL